ncbi:MAG TPA: SMI1/KNR4 family protein [Opitutaceae bacterium]
METELGEVYATQEAIEEATRGLPTGFEPEYAEADEQAGGDEARPGGIAYIRDFSRIVCFAISGDGAPFCLDYRESLEQPAVIWWDDIYWRKIAPDFAAFVGLFDLSEG